MISDTHLAVSATIIPTVNLHRLPDRDVLFEVQQYSRIKLHLQQSFQRGYGEKYDCS